jgi:hypothetical protein
MTSQSTNASLSSLRDFAVRRLQDANIDFDPTAVGRVINDYYEAGNLLRNQQFVNDNVLFHAGIAFRVSDKPDGERFGLQTVRGNPNKHADDVSTVDRYTESEITHKTDYNFAKCAIKPLRETHYFLTIDTHITYRKGRTPEKYEFVGDNGDVREVLTNLQRIMEYMFKTADGVSIWLVPVKPVTWGITVDNLLRQQGADALIPYYGSSKDISKLKGSKMDRRWKAVSLLEKDPQAFRLPKTCDIDQEQEQAKMDDPVEWMNKHIYSLQYATRIGVRKRYEQDHVLVYMANTHLIIKHYDRLQIDIHAFRETISQVLRPYYAKLGHRNAHVRPYMTLPDKSAYVRYTMRDNSLIHDFLVQYIEKAKLNAKNDPEALQALNDLEDFDTVGAPTTDAPQSAEQSGGVVYLDAGMGAEDINIEREFGDKYVSIGKCIFSNSKFKIQNSKFKIQNSNMPRNLRRNVIDFTNSNTLMTCNRIYKQTSRPTPIDLICNQDDHHDKNKLPTALCQRIFFPKNQEGNKMFQRSASLNTAIFRSAQYAKKREFEKEFDVPTHKFVEGVVDLEPIDKASVMANLQAREDAIPSKNVLVTDPKTGDKYYERRREKESNAFITINTHQVPKIGVNEKQFQLALELVINKLFSEQELQNWIEIKEPFLSKGDKLSLDFKSEECVFKSIKIVPAVEIGPINGMLHAHVIFEIAHYTMISYDVGELGLRAAELWRALFPMDLTSDRAKDIKMQELLDAYNEEKAADAINKDYSINEIKLYGKQKRAFYHKTGRPAYSQYWKGLHRIRTVGQLRTFFKHQRLFVKQGINRKTLEQQCRKYIDQHYDELHANKDKTFFNTKSMYSQIQITQSNAEKARMNYISKNKVGAERGVIRLSTMQTDMSDRA